MKINKKNLKKTWLIIKIICIPLFLIWWPNWKELWLENLFGLFFLMVVLSLIIIWIDSIKRI